MEIDSYVRERSALVDRALEDYLSDRRTTIEPKLLEAMRYSLLSGGKRIRPILVLAAGEVVGAELPRLLPFACAVEMVHTYSLIHDDLPAMDDDDMRRGRPSNHVVFGEGIAILAGDALLTEAFVRMSRPGPASGVSSAIALRAVLELATAAGPEGMVGGQTADLLSEGDGAATRAEDSEGLVRRVESIHRRKTGALLRASVRVGAIVGGADPEALERLSRYGENIGLAFQIADDLLDETGNTQATGKSARRDRERGKLTYPSALGIERARQSLRELLRIGLSAVSAFDRKADPLRELARTVVQRAL